MLKKHLCVENKTEPTDQGGNYKIKFCSAYSLPNKISMCHRRLNQQKLSQYNTYYNFFQEISNKKVQKPFEVHAKKFIKFLYQQRSRMCAVFSFC